MELIISPWVIYAMSVCDGIKIICVILSIVGSVVYTTYSINSFIEDTKVLKWPLLILVPVLLLAILVPEKSTIIEMIVAKNITADRVSAVAKSAVSGKDEVKQYVLDIIMAIKKDDSK